MSIPRMNYPQYRKARKLVRECCNYCDGNCLLLDDPHAEIFISMLSRSSMVELTCTFSGMLYSPSGFPYG